LSIPISFEVGFLSAALASSAAPTTIIREKDYVKPAGLFIISGSWPLAPFYRQESFLFVGAASHGRRSAFGEGWLPRFYRGWSRLRHSSPGCDGREPLPQKEETQLTWKRCPDASAWQPALTDQLLTGLTAKNDLTKKIK
jgi:hypothetical protein